MASRITEKINFKELFHGFLFLSFIARNQELYLFEQFVSCLLALEKSRVFVIIGGHMYEFESS